MKKDLIRAVPYFLNDQQYEIRMHTTHDGYMVKVYKDDKPADPYTYLIKQAVKEEIEARRGGNALEGLIESAKEGLAVYLKLNNGKYLGTKRKEKT